MGTSKEASGSALAFVVIAVALGILGCERDPGTKGGSAPPGPAPVAVVDARYLRLAAELDSDLLIQLAHVLPLEASLKQDEDAPPGQHAAAVAALIAKQGAIGRFMELLASPPRLPPGPGRDAPDGPDAMLRRARTVLLADASRCFQAGDYDAATARLTALCRLGRFQLGDSSLAEAGVATAMAAGRKTLAFVEAGLLGGVSKEAVRELEDALGMINGSPDAFGASWEEGARARLAAARSEFTSAGGAERLAAHLGAVGMDAESASGLVSMFRDMGGSELADLAAPAIVLTHGSNRDRHSSRSISSSIDAAEALIPSVRAALRAEQLGPAFKTIGEALSRDKTQIGKLIIGCPGATMLQLRGAAKDVSAAQASLRP